jgi:hypothetical protein
MTLAPSHEQSAQTSLAARLQDPAVVGALVSILDHADLLAVLVEGMDGLVARSEVIGNSLMGGVTELREAVDGNPTLRDADIDVPALIDAAATLASVLPKAAPGMAAAVESGAIDKLFSSGILDDEAVSRVATLAQGLVEGGRRFTDDPVPIGGALSLLKLLKDPDINRALSYFATVAKAMGAELAKPTGGPPPAAPVTPAR